jgi:FRG domain
MGYIKIFQIENYATNTMNNNDFWNPFEKEIASFNELVDTIDKVMEKAVKKNIQFAWRGQVDASWALHSSLYRRLLLSGLISTASTEKDFSNHESKILIDLHRWGLHSPANIGRLSILNQLAMLQHYGAPTRLIDISFNAWVGVWFAVEEKWSNGNLIGEDKDARLFAFDITNRLINENEKHRKWEDEMSRPWKPGLPNSIDSKEWATSVFAWKPSSIDSRIFAQNGGFLFGGIPAANKPAKKIFQFPKSPDFKDGWWPIADGRNACCLALRPHKFDPKNARAIDGALYTFRIAAKAKKEIRDRLEKMFGYKHSTIYPDYTGFSSFGTPHLKNY